MKIIAESAFNHNGDLIYLKNLAEEAKKTNADYFTVQVMDVEAFCVEGYSKFDIYKNHTLSFDEWIEFFDFCRKINLELIPCILDEPSFELCYSQGFRFLKIHATDISNIKLLNTISEYEDISLILETQCATNVEVKFALDILNNKVECLMHGFSNYPTEIEDLNLNTLDYFAEEFPNYNTGFADHSLDIDKIPLMALAKGCSFLEKHITLTRNNRNFDYQVSLYPHEFAAMVSLVKHYEMALGKHHKHPSKSELPFRDIMYKKVLDNGDFKRSDSGQDYFTKLIGSFEKNNVGVALIARLKSKRLPLKVLKPFHDSFLIDFLYKRLGLSKNVNKTYLATSNLLEDQPLGDVAKENGYNLYLGHAVSVIDRMLELAIKESFGGIFRVTGDNPFTDPSLMDEMITMFVENDLDYVRVNNVPFGVSAELFSTKYLWDLYLNMDNPMNSEYLTLFVLEDENARKGCIDIEADIEGLKYINLSVDYPEDYDRVNQLLTKIAKNDLSEITLSDVILNADGFDREDKDKMIKLPENKTVKFSKFLSQLANQKYIIRKNIKI